MSIFLVKHLHLEIRMGWCPRTGEGQRLIKWVVLGKKVARWTYDVFWWKTKGVLKDFWILFGLEFDKSKNGIVLSFENIEALSEWRCNVQSFLASLVNLVSILGIVLGLHMKCFEMNAHFITVTIHTGCPSHSGLRKTSKKSLLFNFQTKQSYLCVHKARRSRYFYSWIVPHSRNCATQVISLSSGSGRSSGREWFLATRRLHGRILLTFSWVHYGSDTLYNE